MGPADIAAVTALLDIAAAADDHRPLGEPQWLDLLDGGHPGFAGLIATAAGGTSVPPIAYAQLSRGLHAWALEYVVHPDFRVGSGPVAEDLLRRALAIVAADG